jgi:hypothetical protein
VLTKITRGPFPWKREASRVPLHLGVDFLESWYCTFLNPKCTCPLELKRQRCTWLHPSPHLQVVSKELFMESWESMFKTLWGVWDYPVPRFFSSVPRFLAKYRFTSMHSVRAKNVELREHLKGCSVNYRFFMELLYNGVCEAEFVEQYQTHSIYTLLYNWFSAIGVFFCRDDSIQPSLEMCL